MLGHFSSHRERDPSSPFWKLASVKQPLTNSSILPLTPVCLSIYPCFSPYPVLSVFTPYQVLLGDILPISDLYLDYYMKFTLTDTNQNNVLGSYTKLKTSYPVFKHLCHDFSTYFLLIVERKGCLSLATCISCFGLAVLVINLFADAFSWRV